MDIKHFSKEELDAAILQKWERLTLADNFIFYKVFRHNLPACQHLLELLLGLPVQKIRVAAEEDITPDFSSRGIRLDLYVQNGSEVFDIEMQVANTWELPERSRYYQSVMDIDILKKGAPYRALKDNHVIFICLEDIFKRGLPVYTFENRCAEDFSIKLGDRTKKHFFIAPLCAKMGSEGQKAFFDLVISGQATDDFTRNLAKKIEDARHNTQWRMQYMTWERQQFYDREQGFEQGVAQGRAEGISLGRKEGISQGMAQGIARGSFEKAREDARNLLHLNLLSPEQIASVTGLSLAEVTALS